MINHIIHSFNGISNPKHRMYNIHSKNITIRDDYHHQQIMGQTIINYNGYIFRFGGFNVVSRSCLDDFVYCKINEWKWIQKPGWKLPTRLYDVGVVFYEDYIMLVGGNTKDKFTADIYVTRFDETVEIIKWVKLKDVKCPSKGGHRAVVTTDGNIYLYCSTNEANFKTSILKILYSPRLHKYVFGFIRINFEQNCATKMPKDIQQLIVRYSAPV